MSKNTEILSRVKRAVVSQSRDPAYWYTGLFQTLIKQVIIDNMGKIKNPLSKVFKYEVWPNGVIEKISNGLYNKKAFNKLITIDDFNPPMNNTIEQKFKVSEFDYISHSIPNDAIPNAFLNVEKLGEFTRLRTKRLLETFDFDMFIEDTKILTQSTGKKYTIEYDDTISITAGVKDEATNGKITGLTEDQMVDMLNSINDKISSFKTISPDHTIYGKSNTSFLYGAVKDQLIFVWNTKVKNRLQRINAKLFNPMVLQLGIEQMELDFTSIKDRAKRAVVNNSDTIIGYLVDKDCLTNGYEIDKKTNITSLPKFQQLIEHMWKYGWGRNKLVPIVDVKTIAAV